jgi:hypothetical protein
MDKNQVIKLAMEQMALDLACSSKDFEKSENTIVTYKQVDGRRIFSSEGYFAKIATFGKGAVASCNPLINDWCILFFSNRIGIDCFDHLIMSEIDQELAKYSKRIDGLHELYLPNCNFNQKLDKLLKVKWFERDEIPTLYKDERFKHALMYDVNSSRPDVLAVASYEGDKISGMAAASMDSERFWQIGIDVIPEFRQNGIATYLVGLLTNEILKRKAIPYYGTWCSNIASRNIAQNCGFFPAWVEMYSLNC